MLDVEVVELEERTLKFSEMVVADAVEGGDFLMSVVKLTSDNVTGQLIPRSEVAKTDVSGLVLKQLVTGVL